MTKQRSAAIVDIKSKQQKPDNAQGLIKIAKYRIKASQHCIKVLSILQKNSVTFLGDVSKIQNDAHRGFLESLGHEVLFHLPQHIIPNYGEKNRLYYITSTYSRPQKFDYNDYKKELLSCKLYWKELFQKKQFLLPTQKQLEETRLGIESRGLKLNNSNTTNIAKNKNLNVVISDEEVEIKYYEHAIWKSHYTKLIEIESLTPEECKLSLIKESYNIYDRAIAQSRLEITHQEQIISALQEAINLKKNAQQNQSAPVPNHVINTLRNVQQSRLKDIMAGGQKTKQLLVALINGNTSLADEEKEEELDKVRNCEQNAEYQIDCYLGAEFTHEEILFIRAISVIVFNMIRAGEIENHLGLIYIPWHKIYKECGVPLRSDGEGYNPRSSKKIRDVLDLESNLRKDILIKNDFGKETGDTRFISDPQPHIRLVKQKNGSEALIEQHIGVSLRISPYLFFPNGYDDKEFQKFTLIDNAALIRFKKVNKTKVGFSLFIWLEKLISQQNVFKILDWDTIIKTLNLQAEEKKNPKRLKDNIERAFQNMEKQKALITNFKEQKGSRCQRQYYFVNSRYKEKIATIKGSKGTQKPRKK
jgi:hypothetical protein